MSSSAHVNKKNKDILILDKGQTQGLNNTTLTAEADYYKNFYLLMPQKYTSSKQKTLK